MGDLLYRSIESVNGDEAQFVETALTKVAYTGPLGSERSGYVCYQYSSGYVTAAGIEVSAGGGAELWLQFETDADAIGRAMGIHERMVAILSKQGEEIVA